MTIARPIGIGQVTWDHESNRYVAEASDLRDTLLVFLRDGVEYELRVAHEEYDAEGDLLWTDLVAVNPACVAIRVFND